MNVLIVDDNAMNRRLPVLILQTENDVRCDEAASGQEALAKLAGGHFDAVLLDISMPQLSGVEVCAMIRAMKLPKEPRLIAYTAHAMVDEIGEFLRQGFDAVLVKPVNRSTVTKALGL